MDRPTCATCQYFDRVNADEPAVGWCKRRSPCVAMDTNPHNGAGCLEVFPPTQYDCWCGEHPDFPAFIESRKVAVPRG